MARQLWLKRSALCLCLAALTMGLGAGCPSTPDKPIKAEKPWQRQTLALSVEGFMFNGGEAKAASWSGSGVFVAPGIIATNAHVAARAIKVTGLDDNQRPHIFTKILAIDMENDLALLKADYVANDVAPVKLTARPTDPRDLRQTPLLAVGNTGGLGLSTYEGKVTNVIAIEERERIMHDGQTAGGSSGGPVFNMNNWELLGVTSGRLPQYRFSVAIPAWYVSQWLRTAGNGAGKVLGKSFAINNDTKLLNAVQRQVCLDPGKSIVVPMGYPNGIDFLVAIQPKGNSPLIYGMVVQAEGGKAALDQGVVTGALIRAFTTPVPGNYNLVLGAPEQAQGQTCVSFAVGQIDWSKQINP